MPDAASNSTEIIRRVHEELPTEARERWSEADVRTLVSTVAEGLTPNELKMVLSIAAKYDLDPLLHEIWGSRGKNRDGSPGRLLIMVGRDGLLKNARRQPGYRGFDCDVVRAKDEFKVTRLASGERSIEHSYSGGAEQRGEILGAWAQVYQDGRSAVYYFAPFKDYSPSSPRDGSSWKNNPSLMIQKCALSLCLRLAFNISGVLGEEEADRALEGPSPAAVDRDAVEGVLEQLPEDLRDRTRKAYDIVREHGGAVSAASLQMRLLGSPEDVQRGVVAELETWAQRLVEVAARKAAEEEVPEAEVVPDDEPTEEEADAINDEAELRARLAELNERKREIEENPSDEGETSAALEEVSAEIEQVEERLEAFPIPGPERMQV